LRFTWSITPLLAPRKSSLCERQREIVPLSPNQTQPHCAGKRALLLDSMTKLDTVNAAMRERSQVLAAGATRDLLGYG
jgi:hypothetical protein